MEEWNTLAEELVNEELSSLELSKPDMYPIDTKYLEIKENNLDSDDTELYDLPQNIATNSIDSDSTEPYEIEEKIIGTISYRTTTTQLPFKCPVKTCKKRGETQKKISDHYRQAHKKTNKCNLCHRNYSTPHSLTQHLYDHKNLKSRYVCKCGAMFPFKSQLKIHKIKHTRKLNNPCTECSLMFKHYHDMLKYLRSHTAKEYLCEH